MCADELRAVDCVKVKGIPLSTCPEGNTLGVQRTQRTQRKERYGLATMFSQCAVNRKARHSGAVRKDRTRNPGMRKGGYWIPGSASRPRNDDLKFVPNHEKTLCFTRFSLRSLRLCALCTPKVFPSGHVERGLPFRFLQQPRDDGAGWTSGVCATLRAALLRSRDK
jgi:hypothetical protein